MSFDDVIVVVGVGMIGAAMFWLASWPGLLAFVGSLFVIVGVGMARRR